MNLSNSCSRNFVPKYKQDDEYSAHSKCPDDSYGSILPTIVVWLDAELFQAILKGGARKAEQAGCAV